MNSQEQQVIQQEFQARMDENELMNCMRCGFCLPSCPTYVETNQNEAASPRGRIALMKAVADGIVQPDEEIEEQLNLCLGCRACEPVCPSDVKYGQLLEEARDMIQQNKKQSWTVKVLRHLVFNQFFPYPHRIRSMVGLISLYQRSGLQNIVKKTGMINLLPKPLAQMEQILPKAPTYKEMRNRSVTFKPTQKAKKRVAFFSGCLMDTLFKPTNNATIQLLQQAGCEILIPPAQICCGALHGHSGEKSKAKELAKQNIQAFEEAKVDTIITNAGGCGAFLSEYHHLLKDDPDWSEKAKAFTTKIKDLTTVLIELDFPHQHLSLEKQVITYQDSCHLRNVMHTSIPPRKLLQSIKGAIFQEMEDADRCCGSAGIYNIVEYDMSMQILDHKMDQAKKTRATTIVTSNPGCLLQMKLGIEREGLQDHVRAVHIADLLLEAVQH